VIIVKEMGILEKNVLVLNTLNVITVKETVTHEKNVLALNVLSVARKGM